VNDLLAWLREQVDTDERLALSTHDTEPWSVEPFTPSEPGALPASSWVVSGPDGEDGIAVVNGSYRAEHIASHDPARALREVAAKRAILDDYDVAAVSVAAAVDTPLAGATRLQLRIRSEAVRAIAAIYVDRPGWREEWTA